MQPLIEIIRALLLMAWNIYWGLAFGFMLSSLIRALLPADKISGQLGRNDAKGLGLSSFYGAISSSCSYAAASMARTLLIKGATWPNAVVFMVASTNLVFEIFMVIVSLLGWSFFAGELLGGIGYILLAAGTIRLLFPQSRQEEALAYTRQEEGDNIHDHHMQAGDKQAKGSRMYHGDSHPPAEDSHTQATSQQAKGNRWQRGLHAASSYFYMDVSMVGKDILLGIIMASIITVLVPNSFWQHLFLTTNHSSPDLAVLAWNAVAGILIAILAFVCSVGNIALAAVLWHGGMTFGGVIAFILSDLITIPMLLVFKRYFGAYAMGRLLLCLSLSIFLTVLPLDYLLAGLHWLPQHPAPRTAGMQPTFKWDYSAWLNILFIPLSIAYFFMGAPKRAQKTSPPQK